MQNNPKTYTRQQAEADMTQLIDDFSRSRLTRVELLETLNRIRKNPYDEHLHIPGPHSVYDLFPDIVFYCASTLPPDSVRLISAIEARHPGLVAKARDLFGNNALWYGLFRTGRNECEPAVEQRLLGLGCGPTAPNCYSLSYNDIKAARRLLKEA